jgi:hypothetical protein
MSIPSLEDRLRAIEDRLAIYTLIASHPPSADTAAANYTREVYVEDGVFDRGPKLEGAYGVDAIASFHPEAGAQGSHSRGTCSLRRPASHRSTRRSGHRNLLSPDPLFRSSGRATRTAQPRVSQGYRIHRVVANRWQLVKTKGEWMIKTRTILPIDGSSEPLEILSQGLNDVLKSRQKEAARA